MINNFAIVSRRKMEDQFLMSPQARDGPRPDHCPPTRCLRWATSNTMETSNIMETSSNIMAISTATIEVRAEVCQTPPGSKTR